MAATASPLAVAVAETEDASLADYWRFHRAVTTAQLAAWLAPSRQLLIDISGPHAGCAGQAARAGHTVLRVSAGEAPDGPRRWPGPPGPSRGPGVSRGLGPSRGPGVSRGQGGERWNGGAARAGTVITVAADPGNLHFLADGCADGVIADDRTLSRYVAAEYLATEIVRVLRPGGRLLASVDSLVLGMAVLAEQRHWAELTDVPRAEVLLIPWQDGTFTRCYGAAQLRDLCVEAGLADCSIRPRTVLSPSMVTRWLRRDPAAMARLVRLELATAADESFGIQLVVTARKPG